MSTSAYDDKNVSKAVAANRRAPPGDARGHGNRGA